jgi:predicted nucleic acid-binding protein
LANGSVVLDTNIVIALFAKEIAVLQHVAAAERIVVPAVVLRELQVTASATRCVEIVELRLEREDLEPAQVQEEGHVRHAGELGGTAGR